MTQKQRYNVSLPDHVSAEMEKHAKAVKATPTEYAGDIIRWWYGQGCPPVTPDEIELRKRVDGMVKRIKPVPADFDVWKLDQSVVYQLTDTPAEKALKQLGLPNLFAHEKEHDVARLMVAFDNHPTHWLVFNFYKGGKPAAENGLAFSAYSKTTVSREDMLLRLTIEGKKMGAKIDGIGRTKLEIEGVDALHPTDEAMIPDRIEAATFLIAAALTGGKVKVERCNPADLAAVIAKLVEAGASIETGMDWVKIKGPKHLRPADAATAVFPGFPTDVQAQWMVLMSVAKGSSVVTDTIYFDRFKHVPELVRLGADIELAQNVAHIRGVKKLTGAKVMSTDLRASASLVLAGLVAEGTTEVLRVYHLDRGYETLEKKLHALGAKIRRASGKEF